MSKASHYIIELAAAPLAMLRAVAFGPIRGAYAQAAGRVRSL